MSPIGQSVAEQAPPPSIWTGSWSLDDRYAWEWHAHDDAHELMWGSRGAVTVETEHGYFPVPESLGIWIPRGVSHRVVASAGSSFECTYIADPVDGAGDLPDRTSAVRVPRAARELILGLVDVPLRENGALRWHAESVILGLLQAVEIITIDLPQPRDERVRHVASALAADPSDRRTLAQWGRVVGASERNLTRLFHAETGLSYVRWRTRARMRRAIELLAAGESVSATARLTGFSTTSAFVAAFRREVGSTPGAFATARAAADTR